MTVVKICGLSTPATMTAALEAEADMVGLVFYPRSPRNVTLRQAAALAEQARGHAAIVVLTVDADDELLRSIVTSLHPDFIQAHGKETPARIAAIKTRHGVPVIKAIAVATAGDVAMTKPYEGVADLILFDAKAPPALANALPGGNGVSFDWSLLAHGAGLPRFMLSGGLNPDNVAEAVRVTSAPIVDVSSGVESSPGIKDVTLIRKFIEVAKSTG